MQKSFRKLKKWFSPGIRIKRWIFLTALGIGVLIFGVARLAKDTQLFEQGFDLTVIFIGIAFIISGIRSMIKSLLNIFLPLAEEDLVDIIYRKRYLQRGPKIVAIGGGHGLSTLLMGLKEYTTNL